jgi:hypothetical protein
MTSTKPYFMAGLWRIKNRARCDWACRRLAEKKRMQLSALPQRHLGALAGMTVAGVVNYFFLTAGGFVLIGETVMVIFEAMLSAEPSAISTVIDFLAFIKTSMLCLDLVDESKVQPACG